MIHPDTVVLRHHCTVFDSLQVRKVFWPVSWVPTYLGGDPDDPTTYFTIDESTGAISRNKLYPPTFTQQIYKIDGLDASGSSNLVSAYITVRK
ncbi:hypothetical protein RvY_07507-2 [Ramazzottius varieornatus]|uniref:Uncharacterized protein n=1 Tax=Ramazzottius varieornatus TaxID=947166 RepID=A0A1D1V8I4_RAMVA|nr:hypothetical protein RvY_07507-2 [Ramazzottius varieornatus]